MMPLMKDQNGKTALNHAIENKCHDIADLLRERGAK
jgi:ankyrin repeat protein